jgi:hypothetical protein
MGRSVLQKLPINFPSIIPSLPSREKQRKLKTKRKMKVIQRKGRIVQKKEI